MGHDINLNIHYSAPSEIWVKISEIYKSMPDCIWNEWYSSLKHKLTEALDYEIGEPEEGYEFKYWA